MASAFGNSCVPEWCPLCLHAPQVSLCHESINLLIKNLRGELPLRQVSAAALTAALAGSGGIPATTQQEVRATGEPRLHQGDPPHRPGRRRAN